MEITTTGHLNSMVKNAIMMNKKRFYEASQRVSTGKNLLKPSDNPGLSKQILAYKTEIAIIDQYEHNISTSKNKMDFEQLTLKDIYNLVEQAKNISNSPSEMSISQVESIQDQLLSLANETYDNKFLFAGHNVNNRPFEDTDGVYTGDDGSIHTIIDDNETIKTNITGNELFKGDEDTNVFENLSTLKEVLQEEPIDNDKLIEISDKLMNDLNRIQEVTSNQSITYNRLDNKENFLQDEKALVTDKLSSIEDVDMDVAIVDLQIQRLAYEATLAMSSMILNRKTIMDYL
jgi:flagellar hook-associated protein 3 FlgL